VARIGNEIYGCIALPATAAYVRIGNGICLGEFKHNLFEGT
jgi:hypothetical protein